MINEASINKELFENDDKSKKFDSLLGAYNEKGIFPFSLDNPSHIFSTKISSPCKKINNKQKFEFSSLKKDSSINNLNYAAFSGNKLPDFIYGYPPNNLTESSEQKDFFDYQNNIKKEINMSGQKRIRQKLDKEFESIELSKKKEKHNEKEQNKLIDNKNEKVKEKQKEKDKYPIFITINDNFFNLLVNIYTHEVNEIKEVQEKKNISENTTENIKNINIIDKNNSIGEMTSIHSNIKNNSNDNIDNINEQISCICLKSKCLNDYCRCHKNGSICNLNCRCIDCKNKYKYIYSKDSKYSPNKKKLNNMCKCKISNCLWNYCDCKKRGVLCSKGCLCSNCNNCENSNKK